VEKRDNLCWQNRAAAPAEFDNRLGDALVAIFAEGVTDLARLVEELNKAGQRDRAGQPWTEETFQAEMRRLGA
jgi:hypothetical protein